MAASAVRTEGSLVWYYSRCSFWKPEPWQSSHQSHSMAGGSLDRHQTHAKNLWILTDELVNSFWFWVSINSTVLSPDKVLVAGLNYTLETRVLWILFSYSHVHFITSNPLFPIMAFSIFWLYCDFRMDEVFFAKADQLFTCNIYWCPVSSLIPDL